MPRPYVLLSVATSIDSRIDDTSSERLLLSNAADFDRVDQVRAECDAILIGAGTIRADNPRLLVNSPDRRAARVAVGRPEYPLKATVTSTGDLDRAAKFWHFGGAKVAYTTNAMAEKLRERLEGLADVVALGIDVDFGRMLDDLGDRGVGRLMVEGGSSIHTAFLSQGLADELHLAIAPLVVGQADAPSFLHSASYPGGPRHRMKLAEATQVGDVIVLRYLPKQESTLTSESKVVKVAHADH
jgi:riboflavin-specific deaminase-like protein